MNRERRGILLPNAARKFSADPHYIGRVQLAGRERTLVGRASADSKFLHLTGAHDDPGVRGEISRVDGEPGKHIGELSVDGVLFELTGWDREGKAFVGRGGVVTRSRFILIGLRPKALGPKKIRDVVEGGEVER